ncbi:acyltransferase family protein [Jiangella alkaliphila]|uniref:Peptidoglycan/LPS O-acetylase OafA/YrhL, contains acyltransferase and SGNH-hydrolase domains n=1 Tax=Jiangella alkaliphila TaxID=419479 RepID=A0A1H2L0W5_9ACTN|nr:acyltransferase [Jiangella alkaliphila]SDU74231.1 Peptidoglycan/LPS O-acetylase OafA/YrhL, contains acyltransferase and SGNH-hydrolase domains [Jiangella alkaliphila]
MTGRLNHGGSGRGRQPADAHAGLGGAHPANPGRADPAGLGRGDPVSRDSDRSANRDRSAERDHSGGRDRLVDAARAGSLAIVVAGHWLMASFSVSPSGRIVGENALSFLPALRPATWVLQVMPLIFMAGGFANRTVWRRTVAAGGGPRDFVRSRLVRLWRPAAVFLAAVPVVAVVALAAGVPAGDALAVAGLLVQPLWFLAVYTGIIVVAPFLLRWHAAVPRTVLAVLASGAVAVDAVRLTAGPAAGLPAGPGGTLTGWPAAAAAVAAAVAAANLALVWLFAHQLGVWYGDGRFEVVSRRRLWAVLAAGLAALVVLTGPGPYPVSMVGLPGELSNMSPPTVCVLVLSIGQGAALLLARPRLLGWLHRPAPWAVVRRFGGVAMTVYLWHLLVLVAAFGVVLAVDELPPRPGTATWWLTRPVWLLALGAALLAVTAFARWLGRRLRLRRRPCIEGRRRVRKTDAH